MGDKIFDTFKGDGPLVVTAIHDGHEVREEVANLLSLSDNERLREEDPFTGKWTTISKNRIIGKRSRFEVDLNRPKERAVYIEPEDAWGLNLWKTRPTNDFIDKSLEEYDLFYSEVKKYFSDLEKEYRKFIIFDLHTYNHRRDGANSPPADTSSNPEVNIGTGTLDRKRWAPIIDRFIRDLSSFDFSGRHLDVRENVKFRGGNFSRWTHESFPNSACVLAIEFKKFFMDEWTGKPDEQLIETIGQALKSTVPGVLEELKKIK